MNVRKGRAATKRHAWQRYRVEDQETQSLALGNIAFRAYLYAYHLCSLDVALISQVRYLTIWNIEHNIPVQPTRAALVRTGLQHMTGVAYTGPIIVQTNEEEYDETLRSARKHTDTQSFRG